MKEKMKDSGIPWIGQIPENWEVKRLKSILHERNEKNNPLKTTKILSLTNDRGVIPYDEKGLKGNNAKEDLTAYKIVNINDIVVNSMNVIIGSVGLSKYYGAVSPVYYMLYCDQTQNINFYNYIFSTKEFQKMLVGYGNGILEIRMRIPMSNLNNILLPIPSLTVQQKIVEILDKKCGQIDELVRIEENEIEKLKEYKTSLITKVVTKGLDPNAKMKDSDIPWIGQIPYDWEVKRLKYIADIFLKGNGITKDDVVGEGNTPCVRYGDIYTTYEFKFNECKTRTNKEKFSNLQYFTHGDILFTTTGELVEEIGKSVVYMGNKECLAGGDVVIMKHSQEPVFLGYALESSYVREQKSFGKLKLKVVHISIQDISNLYVALPTKNEQVIIGKYLDEKCEEIDNLIKIKQEKIEKMKEYKKSLIYQYVTGKKEV